MQEVRHNNYRLYIQATSRKIEQSRNAVGADTVSYQRRGGSSKERRVPIRREVTTVMVWEGGGQRTGNPEKPLSPRRPWKSKVVKDSVVRQISSAAWLVCVCVTMLMMTKSNRFRTKSVFTTRSMLSQSRLHFSVTHQSVLPCCWRKAPPSYVVSFGWRVLSHTHQSLLP